MFHLFVIETCTEEVNQLGITLTIAKKCDVEGT